MNAFEDEDIEQLFKNPRFLAWLEKPSEELDDYWLKWMALHPDKKSKLLIAKDLFQTLEAETLPISADQETRNIDRILEAISSPKASRPFSVTWIAAGIALLVAVAFFVKKPESSSSPTQVVVRDSESPTPIIYENKGSETRFISLSDGSTVLLKPESSLKWHFNDSLRSVQLTGEAFFEIAKNPEWPFAVQTRHLTMHVLGTSFRVRDFDHEPPLVRVNTGKVTVAVNKKSTGKEDASNDGETIILSSRELITFETSTRKLVLKSELTPATDVPLLPIEKSDHIYKRTPVSEVFRDLAVSYGIRINYDAEAFANCSLTAKLGDDPLQEKLRMICLGLGFSLRQVEENIYDISGPGCR